MQSRPWEWSGINTQARSFAFGQLSASARNLDICAAGSQFANNRRRLEVVKVMK